MGQRLKEQPFVQEAFRHKENGYKPLVRLASLSSSLPVPHVTDFLNC